MDATTAASTTAGPIGDLAGNFYLSKQAIARGEAIGLDVVSLYGAGRASMLGGVDPEAADAIFYSPGNRVSTPAGAGTRPMGIFHRTGAAPAVAARVAAASTVTAMAHSIVRRSMYCMGLMLLSRRAGQRFSFLLRLELSATPTRPAGVGNVGATSRRR